MPRLDLREVPFYYINLDDAVERRERTESQLKELGIKSVTRVDAIRHSFGAAGTPRSMLKALELAHNGEPFVLMEDDVAVKRWDPIVEIPEDADAFYLGISGWGRMNSHSGPFVQWDRVDDNTLQVYTMLSGHAIMYISDRYIDLAKRMVSKIRSFVSGICPTIKNALGRSPTSSAAVIARLIIFCVIPFDIKSNTSS